MPLERTTWRVFLSSPGDVATQRELVRATIAALNDDPLLAERGRVEVVAWDTPGADVPMSAARPQVSVNAYLPLPRECDLTIVLLWGRIGTPLPPDNRRADGTTYASGTVWELEDARNGGREVLIYRRPRPPTIEVDDPDGDDKKKQYERVKEFVATSLAPDGSLRFGIHDFEHDGQLAQLVEAHLKQFARQALPLAAAPPSARPAAPMVVPAPAPDGAGQGNAVDLLYCLGELIQLCDREGPRDRLVAKMRERAKLDKGSALFCILPGGARQGHCGFLERVCAYELRYQVPNVEPGQVILVPRVVKDNLETPEMLGDTIEAAIRARACDAELDSWPKLQDWMNGGNKRIFMVALDLPSDVLSGRERLLLANAATWLGRWVTVPARQVFVLVACLRYAGGERERVRVRRVIDKFVAGFNAPAGLPPTIVPLPELASITREDIERWWMHEAVKPGRNARWKAAFDELFAEREQWAMDDLRDQLDKLRDRLAASF
jgi:hypothetical protein